jgi:hypothetical protein
MSSRHAFSIVTSLLISACAASYSPAALKPGDSVDAAVRRLGEPTGRYPRADGASRLEFARGPLGRHTYMLDFDGQGSLITWQQVLDDAHFATIRPGMSTQDLLSELGHPSETWGVRYHDQTVWSYRYANNDCLWFSVGVSPAGRVEDSGFGIDPRCERREKH